MPRGTRWPTAVAALLLLLAAAGCGEAEPSADASLAVYMSAPLSGPDAASGRALVAGAKRALQRAEGEAGGVEVVLEPLDSAGEGAAWDPAAVAANARTAEQDSTSIAYLGELEPEATRTSLPISNDAGILQVAPGSGGAGLVAPFEGSHEVPTEVQTSGVRSFGRLSESPPGTEEAGFQAMAVILAAVDRAPDPLSRGSVLESFFDGGRHDSVAGPYAVDDVGEVEFEQS